MYVYTYIYIYIYDIYVINKHVCVYKQINIHMLVLYVGQASSRPESAEGEEGMGGDIEQEYMMYHYYYD